MKYEELKKLHQEYDLSANFYSGWNIIVFLRKRISPEDIISASWNSHWRTDDMPPDFFKESTYEECVDHWFDFKNDCVCIRMNSSTSTRLFEAPRTWKIRLSGKVLEEYCKEYLNKKIYNGLLDVAMTQIDEEHEARRAAELLERVHTLIQKVEAPWPFED